jgi:hypothetical protein
MNSRIALMLVSAAVLAAGCKEQSAQTTTTVSSAQALTPSASASAMPPGMRHGGPMMGGMCPAEVPGTTVTEQDSQGGATLVFGTTGDVMEVRNRVRAMAEMHNRRQGMGPDAGRPMHGRFGMHDGGMHMPWGDGGMPHMMMGPPSQARVDDLERGAQLVLTAANASDTDALRAHARKMVEQMGTGHCGPPGPRPGD